MKIGLLGFDFSSPNKGCEALTFSFVNMLIEICGKEECLELYNFSYSEFGEFKRYYPKIKYIKCRPHLKNPKHWLKILKEFNSLDCIFDITYGDGFSDIYGKMWNVNTNILKQIANMSKTPMILLPQTYGPYKSRFLKRWAVHIVKKSAMAFSRDKQSADEMANMGCKNVIPVTDIAFALPFYKDIFEIDEDAFHIGFNVSSLLWDGGHDIKLKTDYREYCRRVIMRYTNEPGVKLHLIPHVIDKINDASPENDSRVCKLLHKEFPETILAPDFDTPIQAKSYICNMDVFIGARMHSTIGSMSSGVPTIPFSYSKKFEGLFGNLEYPYVISATQIDTGEAVSLTEKYIQDRDALEANRKRSMSGVDKKLLLVRNRIQKVLQ